MLDKCIMFDLTYVTWTHKVMCDEMKFRLKAKLRTIIVSQFACLQFSSSVPFPINTQAGFGGHHNKIAVPIILLGFYKGFL